MNTQKLSVSIENRAPQSGTNITPVWVGFHNGGFDTYDRGAASSPGLERLAEDGNNGIISQEFQDSGFGDVDGTVGSAPVAPGTTVREEFTVDASQGRYFNYASMVLPSNDTFVANGNPLAIEIFDEDGNFIGAEFTVTGSQVLDAGTEVNDEIPANTAFFGQMEPDTGVEQNGTVQLATGFKPVGSGGILDAPRFANADYTAPGYEVARIRIANLVEGSDANDTLAGTSAQDDIFGGEGSNTLFGNGGNDRFYAGAGDDRIFGAGGDDFISAGEGNNELFGNGGNDTFIAGSGNDTIYGAGGNDTVNAGDGNNVVFGNGGNDTVTTGSGNDTIYGAGGNDTVNAGDGNNVVYGNGGNDIITTGVGQDIVYGAGGDEVFSTGAGDDVIYGNGGSDRFDAGTGFDQVYAAGGSDTFVLNTGEGYVDIFNYGVGDSVALNDGLTPGDISFSIENGNTLVSSGSDLLARLRGTQVNSVNFV